jgi:lactobin A/cerein 7B family class IIb bacteriocin
MSLENMNLVELNTQEVENTEGGYWPIIIGAIGVTGGIGLIAGAAYYYATH